MNKLVLHCKSSKQYLAVASVCKTISLFSSDPNFKYEFSFLLPYISLKVSSKNLVIYTSNNTQSQSDRLSPWVRSSRKTYCVAFWASLVALLAGSSNNGSCIGFSVMVRKSGGLYARMIYLYLDKHELFSTFQGFPCVLRGSLAYIFSGLLINMQYVNRAGGRMVSSYRNFFVQSEEIKGSGTFLMLILREKRLIILENITPVFH